MNTPVNVKQTDEPSFRSRMQDLPFPHGAPKQDQLMALHNQLVDMIDIVIGEQNRKIDLLATHLAMKAGREQLTELGKDLSSKIESLLGDIRHRMGVVDDHHHDHPVTIPTVLELVAAGSAQIDSTTEYSDNALVMCVLRDGGLHLFDVLRDEHGLPRYEPFNQDADERELAAAVLETYRTGNYKPGQLVYITVNLITTEPLDETSYQISVASEKQS